MSQSHSDREILRWFVDGNEAQKIILSCWGLKVVFDQETSARPDVDKIRKGKGRSVPHGFLHDR